MSSPTACGSNQNGGRFVSESIEIKFRLLDLY